MNLWVFWIISALMLGFGAAVVLNRNPVASALSLVLSFIGLAVLFVTLDAYFAGVIQVLVYAGAVMVLFLFIIMLLDLRAEEMRKLNLFVLFGGAAVTAGFVGLLVAVLQRLPQGRLELQPLPEPVEDVKAIGMLLFTEYNLPLQLVGALLVAATIGVVVLGKREKRAERKAGQ